MTGTLENHASVIDFLDMYLQLVCVGITYVHLCFLNKYPINNK